jgi:hypothetical protein
VSAGDVVRITSARVHDFFDQIQLTNPMLEVTATDIAAPIAVDVASADEVRTGGTRADALEAVLVRVPSVSVTDVAPPPGGGDRAPTQEFEVDGGLRVDDYLYLITPFPEVGASFESITGVLAHRNNHKKLLPRSATDYTLAP